MSRERRSDFVILRIAGDADSELRELLPDPDRILGQGAKLSGRGNSCVSVRVTIALNDFVLKRYNYRGLIYGIRHILRSSRARRNWVAANTMRRRGIVTPKPVLCLEERRFLLLKRSYILFEYLIGKVTLAVKWRSLDFSARVHFMRSLGNDLGKMHASGCIHGDTNWDNILVDTESEEPRFCWVDLDCARVMPRLHPRRATKDIAHVLRDLERLSPGDHTLRDAFLTSWSNETGIHVA